jgi:predicted nucleic acid-binding protein
MKRLSTLRRIPAPLNRWAQSRPTYNVALENTVKIWDLGRGAAEIFGLLKAELESEGTRLDDLDLAIAACALNRWLTLVTNNVTHFSRVRGLRLENWATVASRSAAHPALEMARAPESGARKPA